MKFRHSGCLGDIIYSLPVMKWRGGGDLQLVLHAKWFAAHKYDGTPNGLSLEKVKFLKSLLLKQDYVKSISIWNGEKVDLELDEWYGTYWINRNGRSMGRFIADFYGVPQDVIRKPWIEADKKYIAEVVFNRTTRYTNDETTSLPCPIDTSHDYYNSVPLLKNYLQKYPNAVFVGHQEEWAAFCQKIGTIKFQPVKDLNEMAAVINGCRLFIGNQSAAMAIAIALGKSYIQETYTRFPDCLFSRKNVRNMGIDCHIPIL